MSIHPNYCELAQNLRKYLTSLKLNPGKIKKLESAHGTAFSAVKKTGRTDECWFTTELSGVCVCVCVCVYVCRGECGGNLSSQPWMADSLPVITELCVVGVLCRWPSQHLTLSKG